jgi:hypothetical protein
MTRICASFGARGNERALAPLARSGHFDDLAARGEGGVRISRLGDRRPGTCSEQQQHRHVPQNPSNVGEDVQRGRVTPSDVLNQPTCRAGGCHVLEQRHHAADDGRELGRSRLSTVPSEGASDAKMSASARRTLRSHCAPNCLTHCRSIWVINP